jgi:hypothetical protein
MTNTQIYDEELINDLVDFSLFNLVDADDTEIRLTIFLIAYMLKHKTNDVWIYREELITGLEQYPSDSKREVFIEGTGLSSDEIDNAVHEINRRGILAVLPDETNYVYHIYKLNH